MSGTGRGVDADELHDLAPLYAVDALDGPERTAFGTHLAGCPRCRAEVAEHVETVSYLAEATALEPPPAVRAGVLDAIHGTPPLPATDAAGARAAPRQPEPSAGRTPARGPTQEPRASRGPGHVSVDGLRRRYRRILAAAVAAALVPGVVAGGWGLGVQAQQRHQEQVVAQEQERVNRLLTAADVTARTLEVEGRTGTLLVSQEQDAALFVSSLPDPGQRKEYQLWLVQGDDAPVPDAHFRGGQQRVWLTGDVADADAVAMTVEPAGGSTTPTMPLVASTEI